MSLIKLLIKENIKHINLNQFLNCCNHNKNEIKEPSKVIIKA